MFSLCINIIYSEISGISDYIVPCLLQFGCLYFSLIGFMILKKHLFVHGRSLGKVYIISVLDLFIACTAPLSSNQIRN